MINTFDSKDYKRSRGAYIGQCTFEYFISLFVADAFLAKLLTNIGLRDSLIGIISSFVTLAFLFQLLSIVIANKIKSTKRVVIIFETVCNLLFFTLYTIPFMPFTTEVKTTIVILSVIFAYISKYLVASILFKWANGYVEPSKRGRYSAVKEMISLITGIVFTLSTGYIIDQYEALGNIKGGFIFISISILVLSICNFVSLLLIKDEKKEITNTNKPKAKDIIKNTLGNKNFVNITFALVLWDIARYLTIGFLGTFKTKELLLSVGAVQVINMVANLIRLSISLPFGKYSDKYSFASGLKLAYIIVAIGFLMIAFTTSKTWWFIILYTILFNVSLAGSNQNASNITYSYVKNEYFVHATAIKNSISGILGFGASLVGSKILSHIQANGNTFFGVPVYGQQVLGAISFVIMIVDILFIHFVIEKQKVMVQ
ncbi:MAG: MFS transporter [Ruminococcaceae bacterium]|nr:MFS transporter [Oscillospiraceae bacterium]